MPTLAEITANPQALEDAANDFAAFHSSQKRPAEDMSGGIEEDMNRGIETDEQFIALINKCGANTDLDYKKFCEIGEDD